MGWLSRAQLSNMGFLELGDHVLISDKASLYNCRDISIGSNVRVDDFCVISAGRGGVMIGSHIHIAVYSSLMGTGRIVLSDFCNLSSRVAIYSSSDDYSGRALTNPTIPRAFTAVTDADVIVGRHVIIGCGSVVLPGVTLGEGAAVGALSLVESNCDAFCIYAGIPARRIKERSRDLLEQEKQFLQTIRD